MRSVLVHLRDASPSEVAALLSRTYPVHSESQWIAGTRDAPILYIERYDDIDTEYGLEHLSSLVERLGRRPAVSMIANVSGRSDGTPEVRIFVMTLLTAFHGVASDDFTAHFWTADEVAAGHAVEGHGFFDDRGWHAEASRRER